MAERLEQDDLQGALHPKPFHDSVTISKSWCFARGTTPGASSTKAWELTKFGYKPLLQHHLPTPLCPPAFAEWELTTELYPTEEIWEQMHQRYVTINAQVYTSPKTQLKYKRV